MGKPRRRVGGDRQDEPRKEGEISHEERQTQGASIDSADEERQTREMTWAPALPTAFGFVVLIRMLSAGTTCVGDCDETYNYWEPLHYLLYGFGFQTWEYAPRYALRSYFYLLPSFGAATLSRSFLSLFGYENDKPQIWLGVRIFHVLCCAVCEVLLYSTLKSRMGSLAEKHVGALPGKKYTCNRCLDEALHHSTRSDSDEAEEFKELHNEAFSVTNSESDPATTSPWIGCTPRRAGSFFLILSATSAGMFVSAPALLPSSSAMLLFLLVMTLWLQESFVLAIMVSMVCVFGTGWPFIGVVFAPMLLNCAWVRMKRGVSFAEGLGAATAAAIWTLFCATVVTGLATWTDSFWYGRLTSPTFNILKYNVLDAGKGRGDELYGVEPASFYVKNLLLNTTVAFPLALALPLLAMLVYPMADKAARTDIRKKMLLCSPGFMWLAIMFSKAHKEERFLYPVYPSIFMAAAFTLDIGVESAGRLLGKIKSSLPAEMRIVPQGAAMACALFGVSLGMCRTAAVVRYYNAPCNMFKFLYYKELKSYWVNPSGPVTLEPVRLCLGGEWYLYPSSFYVPHSKIRVSFLRSDFHGQLPQPFPSINGTMAQPLQPFNDVNAEEADRFVELRDCDYVMAATYRHYESRGNRASSVMQDMMKEKELWETVLSHKLLDAEFSHPALRAFFIPYFSDLFVRFGRFNLYRRAKISDQELSGST